jgi:hypothetical protein
MKLKSTIAVLVMAAVPGLALAQTTSTPRIDKRQELQEKRIDHGVQSGQLNEKEAARLEKGQERVQKMEDKAVADGKVTAKERARIEHAQDQQSRKIYREKHDRQHAGQHEKRHAKRHEKN